MANEAKLSAITARQIRVSDESHLWAESYDPGLHDVLEVQAQVACAVARGIQIKLTPLERGRLGPARTRSINSQAHALYLRARHFWYRRRRHTQEHRVLRRGADLIELTREPSFAGLHSDGKFRELVQRIGWPGVAAD